MPYLIQNTSVDLPTEPLIHQGATFVSLREVTVALGGTVTFDAETNGATATITPWSAHVVAGSFECTVEGEGQSVPVELPEAPYLEGGEMYVPAHFFQNAFGYEVEIEAHMVSIVNPNTT